MSIDYTIAAIPTVFGGVQYRSRLEARWAAFFCALRMPVEYEPADLGTWSPDFLILSRPRTLVEIKPISAFDADTGDKMVSAAVTAQFDGHLLLLGTSPFRSPHLRGTTAIGWCFYPDSEEWRDGGLFLIGSDRKMSDQYLEDFGGERVVALDAVVSAAWNVACNAVQWRPA